MRRSGLLHPEALAVYALDFGGIGFVSADLHGVQIAIVLILAMVGTVADGAADTGVGRTVHKRFLLREVFWLSPMDSLCRNHETMQKNAQAREHTCAVIMKAEPMIG